MKLTIVVGTILCVAMILGHAQARCKAIPGYIYIIEEKSAGHNGLGTLYKVGGVEGDVDKVDTRRGNLQTGNPRQLIVKKTFKVTSCKDAEKAAHVLQQKYGVNYGGGTEWYKAANFQKFWKDVEDAIRDYIDLSKSEVVKEDALLKDKSRGLLKFIASLLN